MTETHSSEAKFVTRLCYTTIYIQFKIKYIFHNKNDSFTTKIMENNIEKTSELLSFPCNLDYNFSLNLVQKWIKEFHAISNFPNSRSAVYVRIKDNAGSCSIFSLPFNNK